MADLIETPTWDLGVYQLEATDPVQGGPDGIDNRQAQQLANRLKYLQTLMGFPFTAGGLPWASGANALSMLPIGAAGKFLKSSGSAPTWADNPAARVVHVPLTGESVTTSSVAMVNAGLAGATVLVPFSKALYPPGTTFTLHASFSGANDIEVQLWDYNSNSGKNGVISVPSGFYQAEVALTDLPAVLFHAYVKFRSVGGGAVTLYQSRIIATLPS